MESLDAIRVVLMQPTHPGNIGATARAMKNMGLSRLCLVAPTDYPSPEAEARAVGAADVLEAATICKDLDEAIGECHFVVGTTARSRRIEWPFMEPAEAAVRLIHEARRGPVALLFGQERSGLTNTELDRCQVLVHIPANPAYSSLNLASAVQILSYEIYKAATAGVPQTSLLDPPATQEEMNHFYEHLEKVLEKLGFLDPNNPRLLMRRLRRLFNRIQPDKNEANILRGILTAIEQKLKIKNKS